MANTINEKHGIIIAEKSDDLKFAFKKSFSFNILSPNHLKPDKVLCKNFSFPIRFKKSLGLRQQITYKMACQFVGVHKVGPVDH